MVIGRLLPQIFLQLACCGCQIGSACYAGWKTEASRGPADIPVHPRIFINFARSRNRFCNTEAERMKQTDPAEALCNHTVFQPALLPTPFSAECGVQKHQAI